MFLCQKKPYDASFVIIVKNFILDVQLQQKSNHINPAILYTAPLYIHV